MAGASCLTTNVVDLASVPLFEIRSTRDPLVVGADQQQATEIRSGGNVESIQGQRD